MARTFFYKNNIPRGDGIIPKIKVELFGDWDKTMNILKRLGPDVKIASIKAQLKVGEAISKKVKAHLRNQDLGWQELSYTYYQAKGRKGLSGNTLMAYKTYYENIGVWQSGNKYLVFIGVKRGIYTRELNGRRSKLDVATIAGIHEFSSGERVPRRPLWNPTIAEIGGAKGIKSMYIGSLVWHLRKMGIPVKVKNNLSITIDGTKFKF